MKKVGSAFLVTLFISSNLNASGPVTPAGFNAQQQSKVTFKENKGQVSDQSSKPRPDVLFSGSDGKMTYHLKNDGISYQLSRVDSWKEEESSKFDLREKEKRKVPDQITIYRLDINWLNVNRNAVIEKGKAIGGYDNYYLAVCPNGATNIKTFEEVTYKNIYSGIDLHYYSKDGHLKYDYIVQPNTDYKQIQLEIKGANKISINTTGELVIATPLGKIIEEKPIVFQNGVQIPGAWKIEKNTLSFELKNYDPNYELIIDPMTRLWGTYYGGTSVDCFTGCSTNDSNYVYASGMTLSPTSIATSGAHQTILGTSNDYVAMLVKFNPLGQRIWGTYYGGNMGAKGRDCAVDKLGNVYLTGETASTNGNSIATSGTHQSTISGNVDVFLAKFTSAGVRIWGTYYGDVAADYVYQCATDPFNNIYIAGYVDATSGGTLIATSGSHQSAYGGGLADAYLAKFNSSGIRLWGTYYGGISYDAGHSCATDVFGNVYLGGETGTSAGTIIASSGSHQSIIGGGGYDAYLVKFDSAGVRLWGTYYGGTDFDAGTGCATDASGNIYISGVTSSTNGVTIATSSSHQNVFIGSSSSDAFLAKFNSLGVRQWGTYYGAGGEQYIKCATDINRNIFMCGGTGSNGSGTIIATTNGFQQTYAGNSDGFLAKFDSVGVRQWGTFYGGTAYESDEFHCVVDAQGMVYLCGLTLSNTGTVIANMGSYQSTYGGGEDGFLVKFDACTNAPNQASVISGNFNACQGSTITFSVAPVFGATNYTWTLPSGWSGSSSSNIISVIITTVSGNVSVITSNNCGVSPAQTLSVTVYGLPNISIIASNSIVCSGKPVMLSANGGGSYVWSTSANGPSITVSPSITFIYTVTGTDINGCSSSAVKTISVIPSPSLSVTSSSTSICAGQADTLNVSGTANSYTWSTSVSGPSITVSPTITTSYTVSGKGSNGCVNSATITLQVNPLPSIMVLTNDTTMCTGETVTLTANGASTYSWDSGANGSNVAVSPTITTSYTVTGTDANGCTNTAVLTQSVDACVGIKENNKEYVGISIYPNPSNGELTISIGKMPENTFVEIYNGLGQIISKKQLVSSKTKINLSDEANGIYLVLIKDNSKYIFNAKVVIE